MERGHRLAQLGKIWRAIPLLLYSRLVPEDVITSRKSELSLRKPRPCWYLAAASLGSPLLQPKEPPYPPRADPSLELPRFGQGELESLRPSLAGLIIQDLSQGYSHGLQVLLVDGQPGSQ